MEGTAPEGVHAKRIISMKLSTEGTVAAAITVAFAMLSFGAIAREQSQPGNSGTNAYIATSDLGLNHIAVRGSNSRSSKSGSNDVLGFY